VDLGGVLATEALAGVTDIPLPGVLTAGAPELVATGALAAGAGLLDALLAGVLTAGLFGVTGAAAGLIGDVPTARSISIISPPVEVPVVVVSAAPLRALARSSSSC
jgi:hypothetical protein